MTSTETTVQALGREFLESVDRTHIGAAASKLFSASIGDLVTILSRSPAHKHYSIADIEWMILPAVTAGQFYVVEATHKEHGYRAPIAFVSWAFVSEEVDQRLAGQVSQRLRLRPDEWKSGEIAWVIDAAGTGEAVNAALRWLLAGPLREKSVKAATRDEDGVPRVKRLDPEIIGASAKVTTQ